MEGISFSHEAFLTADWISPDGSWHLKDVYFIAFTDGRDCKTKPAERSTLRN